MQLFISLNLFLFINALHLGTPFISTLKEGSLKAKEIKYMKK